jgi:Leucine-rich repeat (LRR) protein
MQSQQCGTPPNWQNTPKDSHPNLQNISWISNLKNLKSVSFQGCGTLSEISPIKELPNLTKLNVKNTSVKNTAFLANPKLTIQTS